MKKTPLKHISAKKQKQVVEERKLKKQLIEQSGGVCQECGKAPDFRGLQVHHKIFRSHGGKSDSENCIAICGDCHDRAHGIKSTIKAFSKEQQLHKKVK
jgi:5-methylcytosine-specific restriction protein A